MKVKELIERLQDFNPEWPVFITGHDGDYYEFDEEYVLPGKFYWNNSFLMLEDYFEFKRKLELYSSYEKYSDMVKEGWPGAMEEYCKERFEENSKRFLSSEWKDCVIL